jgi:hypothetical protein
MSYDTLKVLPGKERIDICQITVERCTLTNGTAPCAATETCVNSWATCKSKANFTPTDFDIQFCTAASICPDGMIPFLQSVKSDAGEPDPENGLGKRTSVSFTFRDAPHDDIGIDPYIATRTYNAMQQGTFWPKFRTRWPFYQGRKVVWYRGFVHSPFSLANCKRMEFIGFELKGWGGGNITLTAKDPLKLADDDKAEYPIRSTGRLSASLSSGATPTQIDIVTDRNTEYDIQSFEPSFSAIRIGDEIIKYTTVTTIAGGVRISGLTYGGFDQYETTRADHDAGDEVQKCAYFKSMRPIDVFVVLLEDGAGISSTYIPYADWLDEASTWIAGFRLTRLVCSPEGVKKHFDELIPQTSTWAVWWDEEESLIQYRVVRPADVGESIGAFTDDANITTGTVKCIDEPDRLINEVYITLGQIDPTKKIDELGNYKEGFVTINADSQSANETNGRKAKNIYGRWHPTGNRAELQGVVDRMLLNRSFVPIRVEFEIERKDDSIKTANFLDLTTIAILDAFGAQKPNVRVRLLKSRAGDDKVKLTAREEIFASGRVGSFARFAPDSIAAGTEYSAATEDEKSTYLFWSDADGYLGGGDIGKIWL